MNEGIEVIRASFDDIPAVYIIIFLIGSLHDVF
jgi:hypothetical protein